MSLIYISIQGRDKNMEIPYDCGQPEKRKLCTKECKTCYKRSFASVIIDKTFDCEEIKLVPSEFWSSKNSEDPLCVLKGSNRKYWFDCTCGHDFQVALVDCSTRGNWCPYHAGKKLCGDEECSFCFEKSFASVEREWGRPADYLIGEDPYLIPRMSHKRCQFYCVECDHEFECHIYSITVREWPCSYCKGDLLCGSKECNICFTRSFASHKKSIFWSSKNKKDPLLVRKYTASKHWFDCERCGHDFEISISNIISNNSWCPYCSVPCRKLCGDLKCDFCIKNSLSDWVDEKNYVQGQKPLHQIQKGARSVKYDFICNKGHKFSMLPNNISSYQWCPMCPKKTEAKMFEWLTKMYPEEGQIICQATFDWCKSPKSGRFLYYDFYIPELSIIIEIDGPQHFKQISNWCSPEETQKMDRYKEKVALENGISIIRLFQEDVLFDKGKWKKEMLNAIGANRIEPKIVNICVA